MPEWIFLTDDERADLLLLLQSSQDDDDDYIGRHMERFGRPGAWSVEDEEEEDEQ